MNDVLVWSEQMDTLVREQVISPVLDHPATDLTENVLLGIPFRVVREEVIAKGLADFSVGYSNPEYGTLSASDKVLLYGFVNLKKHFFACLSAYHCHREELGSLWRHRDRPIVFDLGCGPGTVGLALSECYPGTSWDYIGVDTSDAMREKAEQMLCAARSYGLFGPEGVIRTYASWAECGPETVRPTAPVLVVCSYLFASQSLDTSILRDLAHWLQSLCRIHTRPVALLVYLNSLNPYANTNYDYFKTLVGLDPLAHRPERKVVQYRKNRRGPAVGSDEFLHELLILRGI